MDPIVAAKAVLSVAVAALAASAAFKLLLGDEYLNWKTVFLLNFLMGLSYSLTFWYSPAERMKEGVIACIIITIIFNGIQLRKLDVPFFLFFWQFDARVRSKKQLACWFVFMAVLFAMWVKVFNLNMPWM